MRINVTFRHMESSEPVRNYVEEKLMRVKKYIDEPVDAQVALSVEKKIRHKIEVTLTGDPDHETKSSYSFTIVASDGTNSNEQAVTVNVSDVNEAPTAVTLNNATA